MIDGISAEEHIINLFTARTSIEDFLDKAYEFIENHIDRLLQ
jgi:hypothetical protein